MIRRPFANYEDYLERQRGKAESPALRFYLRQNRASRIAGFVAAFTEARLVEIAPPAETLAVLCLGARAGEEVEAFRELGYGGATGVDLAPLCDFVQQGDYHALTWDDDWFDIVYSNCLDHVYDLDRFCSEAWRVLRPGGLALFHLAMQMPMGSHESLTLESADEIVEKLPGPVTMLMNCWKTLTLYKSGGLNYELLIQKRTGT